MDDIMDGGKKRRRLSPPPTPMPPSLKLPTSHTTTIYSKVQNFATKILLKNSKDGFSKGNFLCSPMSLEIVLSMITFGAKGQTLEELLNFLGSKSINELRSESAALKLLSQFNSSGNENGGPKISLANGVWVQNQLPLSGSYQGILEDIYKTRAKSVDFTNEAARVVGEINSWVEDQTKGLIKEIVDDSYVCYAVMVLANALYFKGLWEDPFDSKYTRNLLFHLVNEDTVEVPFMRSYLKSFMYGTLDGFKILEIPYKQGNHGNFSMLFFLPEERKDFVSMIEKFDSNPGLFQKQFGLQKVKLGYVCIPKIKMSFDLDPVETMKEMGLRSPFLTRKEFTGIVDSPWGDMLSVSKIRQKAFIEVEEKGTEAAAVTMLTQKFGCARYKEPPPLNRFEADHPFLFMIREKTSNTVLFVGAVLNPKLGK